AAAPPPGATLVQQYNELHQDGWYQVNQWSDGTYTFTGIPPDQYAAYGIPQPGTPPAVAPDPIVSNSWDAQAGNPSVSPDGSNATVIYQPSNGSTGQLPVDWSTQDIFTLAGNLLNNINIGMTNWSAQQAAQPVTDGT